MKNLIKLFSILLLFSSLSNLKGCEYPAGSSKEDAERKVTLETITIVSHVTEFHSPKKRKYQRLNIGIPFDTDGCMREVYSTSNGITGDEFHYEIPLKAIIGDILSREILISYRDKDGTRVAKFPVSFFEKHFHLAKSKNLNFIATINSSGELDLTPDPTSDIRKLKEQSENNQQGAKSEKDAGDSKAADNINLPYNDPDDDFGCVIL